MELNCPLLYVVSWVSAPLFILSGKRMSDKLTNTTDLNFHSGATVLHFWMEFVTLVFSPTQVIFAFS